MDELLAAVIQLYNVQLSKLRGRFLQISAAFLENMNKVEIVFLYETLYYARHDSQALS